MSAKKMKDARAGLTVTKTISLSLALVEQVLDEAELMRVGFSEATQLLLREGIAHRRQVARELEEQEKKAIEERLSKMQGSQ